MIPRSVAEDRRTEGVGERLKRLRLARGFSQRDLSSPGVSYAYISRIEAGARTPSVKALRKLSQKLSVSVEYLETGRDIREVDDRELRLADAELEIRLSDDVSAAESKLERILEEAQAAGDATSAARAQIALGLVAAQRGNHLETVERLEAAVADDAAPPPHLRPDLYTTLGQAYAALGAPDRAVRVFKDCLARVRSDVPDDVVIEIRYATFLSYALTDAGDYEQAADVVREALSRADDQTDPYTRVRLYWSIGRLNIVEGRSGDALEYIRDAIALLRTTDDTLTLARAFLLAAGAELRTGAADEARHHLEQSELLLGAHPDVADLGMLRTGQSHLAALDGDADTAVERARDALALLGDFHGSEQGFAVKALARGLAMQGDEPGANDAYRRAVDILTVHSRRADAGETSLEWADFLKRRGREAEAEPILRRAYDLGMDAETAAHRQS
jgi:transcriptional regulator with XRE-family HTH domain